MIRSWTLVGALLAGALCARGHAQDLPDLGPKDFAYGRVLQLPAASSALVEVALPLDVYRASRTEGLQDVWVFNARGVAVPHALRHGTPSPAPPQAALQLPMFPVLVEHLAAPAEVSVTISRGAAGEVLQLSRREAPAAVSGKNAGAAEVAAYLLDTRALTRGIRALRFAFQNPPAQLILPLSVEVSADLVAWTAVAVEGGLLHLEHAGDQVERDRIELPGTIAAFLRVRPAGRDAFPAALSVVFAEPVTEQPAPVLERLSVRGRALAAGSGVYRFDLGGPVPVERLEVELPEDNSVIAAELWVADRAEGQYQRVAEARFYRLLVNGQALIGPQLSVFGQRARYYELRVDRSKLGLGSGQPSLVTYHTPDELLFLRRGDAPFTLAYGRYGAVRQRFEAEDLLTLLPLGASADDKPTHATLAEPTALGGKTLLEAPVPPPPYATYALWVVLIAGVALLAALAYRLVRTHN